MWRSTVPVWRAAAEYRSKMFLSWFFNYLDHFMVGATREIAVSSCFLLVTVFDILANITHPKADMIKKTDIAGSNDYIKLFYTA